MADASASFPGEIDSGGIGVLPKLSANAPGCVQKRQGKSFLKCAFVSLGRSSRPRGCAFKKLFGSAPRMPRVRANLRERALAGNSASVKKKNDSHNDNDVGDTVRTTKRPATTNGPRLPSVQTCTDPTPVTKKMQCDDPSRHRVDYQYSQARMT